jgi:hypothetical protein
MGPRPRIGENEAAFEIDRSPKAEEEETLIVGADVERWRLGHEPKRAMAR